MHLLHGANTLVAVKFQAAVDEIDRLLRIIIPWLPDFQFHWIFLHFFLDLFYGLPLVGPLASDALIRDHAKRKVVCGERVVLAEHSFRCHVSGRAGPDIIIVHGSCGVLKCDSKISESYI